MRPALTSILLAASVGLLVAGGASALGLDQPGAPVRPDEITLGPDDQTNFLGESVTHAATIAADEEPSERVGVSVTFVVVSGPNDGLTATATTDVNGSASFSYTSARAGVDEIQASFYDADTAAVNGSELVDQTWAPAAVAVAVPDRPSALIKPPGTTSFVAAQAVQALPPGTIVDIGGDRGVSILNFAGRRMTFLGVPDRVPSRFKLVNGLRKNAPIRLKLVGGNFARCKGARTVQGRSAVAKDPKPVRRLWGSGKGRYTTSGKYASATIRGTFWLVADYCNGTLVQVREGTVRVEDLVNGTTHVIRSGQSYFAQKP
jgi:hypothetical protein